MQIEEKARTITFRSRQIMQEMCGLSRRLRLRADARSVFSTNVNGSWCCLGLRVPNMMVSPKIVQLILLVKTQGRWVVYSPPVTVTTGRAYQGSTRKIYLQPQVVAEEISHKPTRTGLLLNNRRSSADMGTINETGNCMTRCAYQRSTRKVHLHPQAFEA